MSFRDGIIFKIASPHTEKIYIGCSSLPLNRAVSGLRASAKFRKLSCNILFQAGDIQSEVLEKFQDITVLEMRKKLGAIQTQYLEKCVNTNRAGRTNADRYRETKRQLEMYRETKTCSTGNTLWRICESGAYRRDLRRYSNTTSRMKKSQTVVKEFNTVKKYSQ